MDRSDLAATLERLHRATDAIGTNLLELEADATYQALDHSPLTGTTAERWDAARRTFADLWQGFSLLTELVADADACTRDEERLHELLTGRSIQLAHERVPVAQRGLLTAGRSTTSCTPDQLLATMADGFALVPDVVTGVAVVWDELVPRLALAREQLLATGDAPPRQLGSLTSLAERLLGDPLAVDEQDVAAVEADLARRHDLVTRVAEVRESFSRELDAARASLRDLRTAEEDGAVAAQMLVRKIASEHPPVAPESTHTELAARLDAVTALADGGEWLPADDALRVWNSDLSRACEAWSRYASECRGALDHRDELRGRLDAYRAMAFATGLAEDLRSADAYTAAHDALYRAPTELAEAEALLAAYQELLAPTTREDQR